MPIPLHKNIEPFVGASLQVQWMRLGNQGRYTNVGMGKSICNHSLEIMALHSWPISEAFAFPFRAAGLVATFFFLDSASCWEAHYAILFTLFLLGCATATSSTPVASKNSLVVGTLAYCASTTAGCSISCSNSSWRLLSDLSNFS